MQALPSMIPSHTDQSSALIFEHTSSTSSGEAWPSMRVMVSARLLCSLSAFSAIVWLMRYSVMKALQQGPGMLGQLTSGVQRR